MIAAMAHDHEADALPQAVGRTVAPRLMMLHKRGPEFDARALMLSALATAGDLLQHLSRGQVSDSIAAYERLTALVGVTTATPVRLPSLVANGAVMAVHAALANVTAQDRTRHWFHLHCVMVTVACGQIDLLNGVIRNQSYLSEMDALEDGTDNVPELQAEVDRLTAFVAGVR